jgi:hypothetical protein
MTILIMFDDTLFPLESYGLAVEWDFAAMANRSSKCPLGSHNP